MTLETIAESMTLAISPAILISAFGLLLLSMTNRIGRVVDRVRLLTRERRGAETQEQAVIDEQLRVLAVRGWLLRQAVFFMTVSLLCIAVMILVMFLASLMSMDEAVMIIMVLFFAGIVSLIVSLYFFLRDVTMGLHALKIEMPGDN